MILRPYEQFLRDDSANRYTMAPEKNYNFQNMKIFYIALTHVTWRFRICDYFCKIPKFCNFMNNSSNFVKSVFAHISVKLKYFAKKIYFEKENQ